MPPDFLVLSGDDALTLPLMAVGGRGIISVASNEIPAEMVQMVEAAERDDFAAARAIHTRLLPLMQVNFVESNPVPVKAAMAAMGLLEEVYRLPMVPAEAGVEGQDRQRAEGARSARTRLRSHDRDARRPTIEDSGRGRRVGRSRRRARGVRASCARRCPPARCAPPSPMPASPIGWRVNTWVKQGILLGFRFGDMVDASMDHGTLAVLRQGHAAAEEARRSAPACASCPADRRFATAPTSRPA